VDGLGFDVSFEVRNDDGSGLRGGIALTLDCPMSGHGRDACVSLEVESADRSYDEWGQRVVVKRPPHNEEWGGSAQSEV
jgi:hypothetical protein